MSNLQKLKTSSLFKTVILSLLCMYFKNIFISLVCLILLSIDDIRLIPVFIIITVSVYLINLYRIDFIKIGIVEDMTDSYCIVNKFLYKVRINRNDLHYGDILVFENCYAKTAEINDLKKNILFHGDGYFRLCNIKLNQFIRNRISTYDDETLNIINQIIYHKYTYEEDEYLLGFGLSAYYLFRYIKNKNKALCGFMILIYSFLFQFEIKFILLFIEILIERYEMDRYAGLSILLIAVSFINIGLFNNYSFIIPIMFKLFTAFDLNIDFRTYLCMIGSFFFYEIDLLRNILFRFFISLRIMLFITSLICIVYSRFSAVLIILSKFTDCLNRYSISIRGYPGITGIIIMAVVIKLCRIRNRNAKLIVTLIVLISHLNNPFFHISFIDVGQGDSALISYGIRRGNILIDTGSVYNYHKLKKELFREGVYQIDHLIISHDDSDHNGNVDRLKKDFIVKNIIYHGHSFEFKDIMFEYLYIDEFDNDNDESLVYLINMDGYSFLFTGDISSDAERVLISKYHPLSVDFLKVAHHGSKTSTSDLFISAIMPRYSIISTSGQYNHPHAEVIERLERYGLKYFNTRDDGTVKIYLTDIVDIIKTANNEFVIIR